MGVLILDEEREAEEEEETQPLLRRLSRRKSFVQGKGRATQTKAALLLLKSFVGTGVLFLPKAYYSIQSRLTSDLKMVECSFHRYFSPPSPCFHCTVLCFS
jgi:hypothetical protein